MRLFINYSSDLLQKKTQRINLPPIQTTDELIFEIEKKIQDSLFSIRFNINGQFVRVIPGWLLTHYGIKHGSALHLQFYQKHIQTFPTQARRKLSRVEEQLQQQQLIRVRQDTALSKMSQYSSHSVQQMSYDEDLFKLLQAAKSGNLNLVIQILSQDLRLLDQFGESGWAVLHYAVFYDHDHIIRYLLSQHVDLSLVTSDGWTPLLLSIKKRNIQTFKTLIKAKGIDINQVTQKGTALHLAVKMDLQQFVNILVDNKADDSLKDDTGKTPIQICQNISIRESLLIPQKQLDKSETKQEKYVEPKPVITVYKGNVFRVRFLTYGLQQNYLVCDPFQGTFKRYESKSMYPKKAKQVIPLLQVTKVQMLKNQDRHFLMNSNYQYFEIFCPHRILFATKGRQLSQQWVKIVMQASFYVHQNKHNPVSFNTPKFEIIQLLTDDQKNLKLKEKRKQKQRQIKDKLAFKKTKKQTEQQQQDNRSKMRQSIFMQHMNDSLILPQLTNTRSDMSKSLMTSTSLHRWNSQTLKITESAPQLQKQKNSDQFKIEDTVEQISKFNQKSEQSRSRHNSNTSSQQELNNKKQNSSTMAQQFKIGISSFEIMRQLGSGSFGKVFLAKFLRSKQIFALKALKKSALIAKKQLKYAIGQATVLKKLNSPFIIQLHHAFQTPQYLYLCLDYCPFGDLAQYLISQQEGTLSQTQTKYIIAQLILAVQHMHQQNIIYRDLKPENILIGSDGFIRLADFGLSKSDIKSVSSSFCGSPAYLSPQMLKQKGVGKQSDVYGIGCIFYQLLIGQPPYYHQDIQILYQNIQKGNLKFTNRISSSAKQLIQRLLQRNPTKRITIQQTKSHSFFKDLDFDAIFNKTLGRLYMQQDYQQQQQQQNISLNENKKPIFMDADYQDDKKINKVLNFSFSKGNS